MIEKLGRFLGMLSKTSEADGSTFDRSVVVYCCRSPEAIGCVLTDLQMPKRDRADLEKVFAKSPNPLPVVFVAGKGDIQTRPRDVGRGRKLFHEARRDR